MMELFTIKNILSGEILHSDLSATIIGDTVDTHAKVSQNVMKLIF